MPEKQFNIFFGLRYAFYPEETSDYKTTSQGRLVLSTINNCEKSADKDRFLSN